MARAKTERLMALVSLLLKRRRPVSKAEIRQGIPDYARASNETFDRIFERDKRELREMGMDIKVMRVENGEVIADPREAALYQAREIGYAIDGEGYFLQQIDFEPEELALLSLAMSGYGRYKKGSGRELSESLTAKLGYLLTPQTKSLPQDLALAGEEVKEKWQEERMLSVIEQCIVRGQSLRMEYYGIDRDDVTTRQVDPYLLVLHSGHWYLVGHCHLRNEIRMFKVSRIRRLKPGSKVNAFSVPEDFDGREYLERKAWELPRHQPQEVRLKVKPEAAWLVREELGPRACFTQDGLEARILVSNRPALIRWLCANCDRVMVEEPRELAQEVRAILGNLVREYSHGSVR